MGGSEGSEGDGGVGRRQIIGIGNLDRGDDGVGIVIARRVRRLLPASVEVREATGEGATLLDTWQGAEQVWLIDAVRPSGMPGRIYRLDVTTSPLPSDFFHYSTHAFGVAEAVELARVLGELPPSLLVYGIEAESVRPGAPLSSAVEASLETVIAELLTTVTASLLRKSPISHA
jgi:hydrogenase maturation protease